MDEKILEILSEIKKEVVAIKEQQKENTSMIGALVHRTDELSASLEGLALNTAKEFGQIRNEMNEFRNEMNEFKHETKQQFIEVQSEIKLLNMSMEKSKLAIKEHDVAIYRLKEEIS